MKVMMLSAVKTNEHPRKLLAALLLIVATVFILILVSFIANPPPNQIKAQVGTASISFSLDRSQVIFPSDCPHAAWSVEGIRAVYINGEATVGRSEREICPWAMQPALRVIFQDDSERTYLLPIRVLSYTPLVWVLLAGAATSLAGALMLAMPRRDHTFGNCQTRGTTLWRIFLSRPLLVIGAITLTGATLRLAHLSSFSLVLDEAAIWQFTHGNLNETLQNNAYGNSAPPLFALLLFAWQKLGQSETWLRLLPALASIAAIPAIYALARRLFDPTAGYIAALLLAVAAPQIEYAQYLREYSLAILLGVLALYAYIRLRQPQPHLIWVGVWIICLLTQYGLVLLIAALDLIWTIEMIRKPSRNNLLHWLSAQVALAITLIVVYLVALRFQLGGGTGASWYGMFYWDGLPASLGSYIFSGFGGLLALSFGANAALIAFSGGAAVGLMFLLARRHDLLPLLILPILAALAAGILGYYPYTGTRQMTYVIPLFILAAAAGLSYLIQMREQAPLRWLAAATLLIGAVSSLADVSEFYLRPSFDQVRPVIETFKAASWQDDALFIIPPYIDSLLDYYYLSQDPARRAGYTLAAGNTPTAYGAQLDALRAAHQRVWVFMQCCEDGLRQYLEARGEEPSTAFASNGNIALYLLE